MDDQAQTKGSAQLDPRSRSRVPPPPMQVIHRGWFRTTITERQADDLLREDRERREREQGAARAG